MADLGRDLGLPYPTVAAWKQRGSIPVAYWREVVEAAHQRGFRGVNADRLIEAHGPADQGRPASGFAEDATAAKDDSDAPPGANDHAQFSRWKPLRRRHFATMEEITDHVSALRDEWNRR